jgi:hypothetical protein
MPMNKRFAINHGHVIASHEGKEYVFSPTFANIDKLGTPEDVVSVYGGLYSLNPDVCIRAAMLVLTCCGDDDAVDVVGYLDAKLSRVDGVMPITEMIIIARHLMKHGIVGNAKPSEGGGKFSDKFDASEYVDAAIIHFGISQVEAWSLTMTQFTRMLEMKFPSTKKPEKISIDDYREQRDFYLSRHKIKEAQNGD